MQIDELLVLGQTNVGVANGEPKGANCVIDRTKQGPMPMEVGITQVQGKIDFPQGDPLPLSFKSRTSGNEREQFLYSPNQAIFDKNCYDSQVQSLISDYTGKLRCSSRNRSRASPY